MAIITVDNKNYEVRDGQNLLQACLSLGFDLPYFCWHPAMGSVGACRQCAIVLYKNAEDTQGTLTMACMTAAKDGTRLSIEMPLARQFRASTIEWLMINHPHDCPVCEEGGECHLQDMTHMTGHVYRRYRFTKRTHRNQYLGPFLTHEMNRCIACYRCIRFYQDYAGGHDLEALNWHDHVYFGRQTDGVLENEFSGNLAEVCPTGVFDDKTLSGRYTRKWDLRSAPSVCGHCAVGCNTSPNERYGTVKRILNRYNGAVNGYFICDRGRFGYVYVNSERRITKPTLRENRAGVPATVAIDHVMDWLEQALVEGSAIGIGSPRASIETNFALRELVGAEHFHDGLSEAEHALIGLIADILRNGPLRTPSLREAEQADAVLVLGEDVSNSAPRFALTLRQATRQASLRHADAVGVPRWQDAGVREATAPGLRSPLFLATPAATRLDDVAAGTLHGAPETIARLGFAIAHALDAAAPAVEGLDDNSRALAERIAAALANARNALIVSGTGCMSAAVIRAAANVARALQSRNDKDQAPAMLAYTMPEGNSLGVRLLDGQPLAAAFEKLKAGLADTVIIAENDLFRRAPARGVADALAAACRVIVLDQVTTATTEHADLVLPAATFAEAQGTLVSSEGRAQRFYAVLERNPDSAVQESWRWLTT
ncbi:MAG: NADH-quinone oxidoreductase subunit NuoG, partial [Nitrococcus sp.]|nr:NADH-quinone oxidoreductase subunit NuoG [Nitrococcus sp.]